ncbi:MAG TPA: nitroreductase/quinone reductase family protein [Nitrososphaeraceae archaeon]|nr:nitroreductase/quinone reductase family protein [Nitrososphaeraceae archaeon]
MIESQFLYLTTIGWRTGKQHTIEIWYVTHNEKYYIMSERGINAHWVRNINRNPRISFNINNSNYDGEGRVIDSTKESQLAAQISEIMNAKYHWDQGLILELRPLSQTTVS